MRVLLASDAVGIRESRKAFIERLAPDIEVVTSDTNSSGWLEQQGDRVHLVVFDERMQFPDIAEICDAYLAAWEKKAKEVPDWAITPQFAAFTTSLAVQKIVATIQGPSGGQPIPVTVKMIPLARDQSLVSALRSAAVPPDPSRVADPRLRAFHAKLLGITGRQLDVLNEITDNGSSDKEIARALKIEESTVHSHVQHAIKKLETDSRTKAAIKWHKLSGGCGEH